MAWSCAVITRARLLNRPVNMLARSTFAGQIPSTDWRRPLREAACVVGMVQGPWSLVEWEDLRHGRVLHARARHTVSAAWHLSTEP